MIRATVTALVALSLAACRSEAVFEDVDPDLNRMLDQPRADPYEASELFPDGKVLQRPPRGTVTYSGARQENGELSLEGLKQGRQLFEVHCAVCHGVDGSGESEVARFMRAKPADLHQVRLRKLSVTAIEQVIRGGYGFMPSYETALDATQTERVAAYVKVLQLSQHVARSALTDGLREELERHRSAGESR
ncbi:MAG: cytochrome c [Polyangiaceae bacterium]